MIKIIGEYGKKLRDVKILATCSVAKDMTNGSIHVMIRAIYPYLIDIIL
jgi:hypothetical protein